LTETAVGPGLEVVVYKGTEVFVHLIGYVIKTARSPNHCHDVAPMRHKLGSYPELQE
jgi:hypothetical protein